MAVSPDNHFEAVPAPDPAEQALQSILDRSVHLLERAFERQAETEFGEIFVLPTAEDTAFPKALGILLTRDGETPEFEEVKEKLFLYFPAYEDPETLTGAELNMIWVKHVDEKDRSRRYTVNLQGIENFESLNLPPKFRKSDWAPEAKILAGISKRMRASSKPISAVRLRDMIIGFRLTPREERP